MKHIFISLCVTVIFYGCKSQLPTNSSTADGAVYELADVDTKPEPEGGIENLYKEWSSNVKYTKEAIEKDVEGKIFVEFVVNTDGRISNIIIVQGLGHGLDEAAINGLEKTKLQWKAGMKDGKKVGVKMILPFVFKFN